MNKYPAPLFIFRCSGIQLRSSFSDAVALSLRFGVRSSFLHEALCVDVESHSVAWTHTLWLHFEQFSSSHVAFSFRVLANYSDLLLLPKRGILIDDKEYKGKRMMTNKQIAR